MSRGLKFGLQIEHKYAYTFDIEHYIREFKKKKKNMARMRNFEFTSDSFNVYEIYI